MRRLAALAGLAAIGAVLARKRRGADVPEPTGPEEVHEPAEERITHPVDREFADLEPELDDQPRDMVAEEEAAAAAEAAAIGGPPARDATGDPAMWPVYQAGGGESEGFEAAEEELIENATHSDGRGKPWLDAFPPEAESDRAGVEYGEPDELDATDK